MARLNPKIKNKIISLVLKGKSLNYINNLTSVGKTTIYYYMRKLKGRKITLVKIDKRDNERIGEFMGLFAGDGNFYFDKKTYRWRLRITFNEKDSNLVEYYRNSITKLTSKKPHTYSASSVKILALDSKVLTLFILKYLTWFDKKTKNVTLRNKVLLKDEMFRRGFLRGLVDSDGYVRKGRKEIYYGSISYNLFKDFLRGLDLFDFKYKTYVQKREGCSDYYNVRFSGEEVDKFVKIIKPIKSVPARI